MDRQFLCTMTSPAAMAVRAMRLAYTCEANGDRAGMFRNIERASKFMALPGYCFDEFVSLGGLDRSPITFFGKPLSH